MKMSLSSNFGHERGSNEPKLEYLHTTSPSPTHTSPGEKIEISEMSRNKRCTAFHSLSTREIVYTH